MAYQARQRDPLLDSKMQAAIEKRGKELLGSGMIVVGFLVAMMLASYSPDDPSWYSATSAPVQNWLGTFGAAIASPLRIIVGWGGWGIPLALIVWGARFVTHRGVDLVLRRVIYLPIAIAVFAIHAEVYSPAAEAVHTPGMGGLFGQTALGMLHQAMPFGDIASFKILAILSLFATIAIGLFTLGATRPELTRAGRFMLYGLIVAYGMMLTLLGRGASGAFHAAQTARQNRAEKRALAKEAALVAAEEEEAFRAANLQAFETIAPQTRAPAQVMRAEVATPQPVVTQVAPPEMVAEPAPEPAAKPGLFARVPLLKKRAPEPVIEEERIEPMVEMDDETRVKSRISDAIKSRARNQARPAMHVEPRLTRAKGPTPLVLDTTPRVAEAPMVEAAPEEYAPETAQPMPTHAPQYAPEYTQEYTTEAVIEPVSAPVSPPVSTPVPTPASTPSLAARVEPAISRAPVAPPVAPPAAIPAAAPPAKPVIQHNVRKPVAPSTKAKAEAQPALQFDEKATQYEIPPLSLLASPTTIQRHHLSDEALEENARMLENVLDDYGVKGEIVSVRPGPVVTMYELEPAPGLKASRVIGLSDDIARSMSALSARVSTVPGRSVIGIELPNENREMVVLREMLSARDFGDSSMKLPLALGKDIGGEPVIANLAKMPHLLIAGTTGSGKSVAINTMILSLLYKLTPEECRLIMIDPKMLELSVYDGIPHLLSPVVTDPKKAVVALKWVVGEMEERYRKMSKMGVRNIDGYNGRVADALSRDEMFSRTVQTGFDDETGDPIFETEEFAPEKMPYIVVVVDEMADLMMVAGKEIEACIQRLAQMARASGIHLIMATQRPSVDVITGTIKANFPTRISFQVTSKIDSRTILGEMGAEQLLGMGDMLYMAGGSKITRVHGPFCSDEEVEEIVNYLKAFGAPEYQSGIVDGPEEGAESDIDLVLGLGGNTGGEDALYDQAVAIVIKDRKCSTSYIQRKLAIGYNKAARLVEQMEDQGLVSQANHVGKREILVPEQQ